MGVDLTGAATDLLATYDAVVRACPANKTFLGDRACPKCGAMADEGCREENRAAYAFISTLRPFIKAAGRGDAA